MSTKSTIYCNDVIHLYEEVLSEEIQLQIDTPIAKEHIGHCYEEYTMSLDEWEKFARALLKHIEK